MPFLAATGPERPRYVLEQVSDTTFALQQPFRYVHPETGREFKVPMEALANTDLASIPPALQWFASRYGRHTPAALLHDYLIEQGEELEPPVTRPESDRTFRVAMEDLDVPWLRGTLMWAAVTMWTRFRASALGATTIILWLLLAGAGTVVFVYGLFTRQWEISILSALGPVLFAWMWGSQWVAAIAAGYGLLVLGPATATVYVSYGVYRVLEAITTLLRKVKPDNRGVDLPEAPKLREL